MATTHDVTETSSAFPWSGGKKCFVIEKEFDCSETNLVSGDTYQALGIPANTLVTNVAVQVITAEGAASTVDVGDGTDPDGWCDGASTNAVTAVLGTGDLKAGKVYAVADTLDVLVNDALDTAVFKIKAVCFDLS